MEWITRIELTNGADVLTVDNETGDYEIDSLQVDLKENNGSTFSFTLLSFDDSLISRFPPRKTTVKIWQGLKGDENHLLTGFVDSMPIHYSKGEYQYVFSGVDYTVKLQDILVNEAYENKTISYIVNDLCTKYIPSYTKEVETCDQVLTIKFRNNYLYDCFEQLAKAVFWNFAIDKNLKFRFWDPSQILNPTVLTLEDCRDDSIDIKYDVSKLVTRLRIEGGKRLSSDQVKKWYGDGETKVFNFPQKRIRVSTGGNIELKLNGTVVNMGIKHIHEFSSTTHYLFDNANAAVECENAPGTNDVLQVTYRYEYPVFFYLDDFDAQAEYGVIERKYTPSTEDETLAKQEAQIYFSQYCRPIVIASIEPFFGYYEAGELIWVSMPELNIDDNVKITSVQYSGVNVQSIKLNIEGALRI